MLLDSLISLLVMIYIIQFLFLPDIEIHLDTQGEEYVYFTDPVLVQMMIHDRRALVNPFSEGTSLEAGIQYNAYVSMVSGDKAKNKRTAVYFRNLKRRNDLSSTRCIQ